MTSIDRRLTLVYARLAAFLLAVVVVIFQALTGWYLGTAIVAAMVVSTPFAWHAMEVYRIRPRGMRLGPVGMVVALACVWLVLCGLCMLLFYLPGVVWLS